jgi:hypothetical protein
MTVNLSLRGGRSGLVRELVACQAEFLYPFKSEDVCEREHAPLKATEARPP